MTGCKKVSLEPSLLQAEQPQLSQPFLRGEVLQPLDNFYSPPLDPLQQLHVLLVLRAPELNALLQVGSHQSGVEWQNHFPWPAGHPALDAAQYVFGFLDCKCTFSAHVQLFNPHYSQVLLGTAVLNPFIPKPVVIPGVAPTHVQDLALGLAEPHEVHAGPLLKLFHVLIRF